MGACHPLLVTLVKEFSLAMHCRLGHGAHREDDVKDAEVDRRCREALWVVQPGGEVRGAGCRTGMPGNLEPRSMAVRVVQPKQIE